MNSLPFISRKIGKSLVPTVCLILIALAGCSSDEKPNTNSKSSDKASNSKIVPATKDDIFLYRGIASSFLCNASGAGVEFPKAVGIAAATYAQVLNGRHGGFVESAGDKQLTNKQLFAGAEFQIVTGALRYCPKEVPEDVKKKVDEAIKNQKD